MLVAPRFRLPRPALRGARRGLVAVTALATAGTALGLVTSTAHAADAPTTVQVSVTTGGFDPDHGSNGDTGSTSVLSTDGRYVVFASSGPVIAGQAQLNWQIVRRDRQLGTSELISKSSAGVMGNGNSYEPSVSADGQVIAFRSSSSNLVAGDTNDDSDIFVHDVRTGVTTRASVTSAGQQVDETGNSNPVGAPSISADGRYVGFTSTAQGLTADDSNGANAYLHDRQTGAIEVVSRNAAGHVVGGHVSTPVTVSANGDFVTFQSLVDNHAIQVLVRDRRPGQETTTSVGGEEWRDLRQSMTPDGRYVVYDTGNKDQVPGDSNAASDVFVHDRVAQTYERVSVSSSGTQGDGASSHGAISDDGRYVAFVSHATNLVPGDTNNEADIFRHDRQTGATIRVSVSANGAQASRSSTGSGISGDGQHVAFNSHAQLSSASTRSWQQAYVRDLTGKYPALHARIGALPGRVTPNDTNKIKTFDIRTGPALVVTWTPLGSTRSATVQSAAVSGNTFTLRSPKRAGKYTVSVSYAGNVLRTRTVNVLKPTAKKLPAQIKKGKLKIRTVGVAKGQKVNVQFTPRGTTGGKAVKRTAKVNKNGVAKVQTATRRGTYQVVVRANGQVLRKGTVRVR